MDATQQDIETCFSEFGKIVSANLIKDPITQASLGTCNLTFANRSDAVKAIEKYNQQMADGRLLSVVEITVPVPPASTSIVGASSSQSTSPTSPKTTTVAATAAVSGNL